MDLISIIILLGIAHGFFLGILLLTKKSANKRANKFFGILYFAFSISIVHFLFMRTGVYYTFPHLLKITPGVLFLFGPLYYFYVMVLLHPNYKITSKSLLHYVPFLLFFILNMPFFMENASDKLIFYKNFMEHRQDSTFDVIGISLASIHIIVYLIFVLRIVSHYRKSLKEVVSSTEKIDLGYIYYGISALFIIFGLMLILLVLYFLHIYGDMNVFVIIVPMLATLSIYVCGYMSLGQIAIPTEAAEIQIPKKYQKSSLPPDKIDKHLRDLRDLMTTQKLYLDSELTLKKLADRLNIQPYLLSQLINERLDQNFFDFVNSFRVEEAKKLLNDSANSAFTILSIGLDAGFNSKSSFNQVFKKLTGFTPTEFRLGSFGDVS